MEIQNSMGEGGGSGQNYPQAVLLRQRFSDLGMHQNHGEGLLEHRWQLALEFPIQWVLTGPKNLHF